MNAIQTPPITLTAIDGTPLQFPALLRVKDAMVIAGVSRRTIYNWIKRGKVAFVRTPGGPMRIVAASLFRDGNVPVTTLTQAAA